MAHFVGAGFASDAFLVALRLPNLFRALFAEGAFSSAFMPMFNRMVAEAEKEGREGLPAGIRFAEDVLSVLLPFLAVFTTLDLAFPRLIVWRSRWAFKGGGPTKFAFAVTCRAHLPLSDADQPGLATRRHPQFAQPLLGQCRGADPAQHLHDRRAAVLPRRHRPRHRAHAGDRGHRLGRGAASVADLVVPSGGRDAPASSGRARSASEAAADDDLAGRGRRGRGAVQPRRSRPCSPRVSSAGLGLLHLLCRPAEPAAARADRHRPRHRDPAALSRQIGSGDEGAAMETQNRAIELALLLTLPATAGADGRADPARPRPVRDRAFRRRGHARVAPPRSPLSRSGCRPISSSRC